MQRSYELGRKGGREERGGRREGGREVGRAFKSIFKLSIDNKTQSLAN